MQKVKTILGFADVRPVRSTIRKIIDPVQSLPLRHHLTVARWHTDSRAPLHIVLLPGLYASGNMFWNNFTQEICQLPWGGKSPVYPIHLYALDMRDHGRSPHGREIFDPIASASDVLAFIQGSIVGGAPVYILGYGVGGYVATRVALSSPELVKGIMICNSNLLKPHRNLHPLAKYLVSQYVKIKHGMDTPFDELHSSAFPTVQELNQFWSTELEKYNFTDLDELFNNVFPNSIERATFLTNIEHSLDDNKKGWKCNIGHLTRFATRVWVENHSLKRNDLENDSEIQICKPVKESSSEADVDGQASHTRSESPLPLNTGNKIKGTSLLWLRDEDGTFESKAVAENLFKDFYVEDWSDFGGLNATHSLFLPRARDVLQRFLQYFSLLENVKKAS